MHIGLVCPYDMSKPGGVQSQVRQLASILNNSGDEATVIAPGLGSDGDGVDLGGTLSFPANGSMVPLSFDPRVVAGIKTAARTVDLLHVHEPLMPFVSLTALRADRPVVATFHAAPGSLGTGFYSILRSGVRKVMGPNVRAVTAVSETAAAALPEELDVQIVPNGVDVAAFGVDLPRRRHRVSFLGRDERRKGLDVLLEAWPAVVKEVPSAELVVMGADRGVDEITWLGRVDDLTKIEILASSTVYVAANLGGESFGIVLVESMAAGTPVLASDLPAFRDVGGDAIEYFTTGDATDLASHLVSLLTDPETLRTMSGEGREQAAQFDWSTVAARYRAVYSEALS